jgi:hypothetical protein
MHIEAQLQDPIDLVGQTCLVAVQGIGGLGHLGIQFARHMGFRSVDSLLCVLSSERLRVGSGACVGFASASSPGGNAAYVTRLHAVLSEKQHQGAVRDARVVENEHVRAFVSRRDRRHTLLQECWIL